MFLPITLFLICLFFMLRLSFIIVGLHKAPILAIFEKYGDPPPYYYPWTQMLFLMGAAFLTGGFLISSSNATRWLGLLFFVLAWVSHTWKDQIIGKIYRLPQVPRWYDIFLSQTSRYERRRIAYMWLRLPVRTRWIYNASDKVFFQWIDLVILASVHDS